MHYRNVVHKVNMVCIFLQSLVFIKVLFSPCSSGISVAKCTFDIIYQDATLLPKQHPLPDRTLTDVRTVSSTTQAGFSHVIVLVVLANLRAGKYSIYFHFVFKKVYCTCFIEGENLQNNQLSQLLHVVFPYEKLNTKETRFRSSIFSKSNYIEGTLSTQF